MLEKKCPPSHGSKASPVYTAIKQRYRLNQEGSKKSTYHLVIDLENSPFCYEEGDSLAIFPQNPKTLVDKILKALNLTGNESLYLPKTKSTDSVLNLLTHANITKVSRSYLDFFVSYCPEIDTHFQLSILLKDPPALKAFLSSHHLQDLLIPCQRLFQNFENLLQLLPKLLPRFYSIASSPSLFPREIHLTLAKLNYPLHGTQRHGTCSYYLISQAPLEKPLLPVYLQKAPLFKLPEPHIPIIMIGPGTGIAPFRAFMQKRFSQQAKENWLFFGEWQKAYDFYYQEEWEHYQQEGYLKLDTAFSRDQDHKIYVQDRIWQQRQLFLSWIEEKQAVLYLCGDAQRMAKAVEKTLLKILEKEKKLSEKEALDYLRALRKERRYLKDVY